MSLRPANGRPHVGQLGYGHEGGQGDGASHARPAEDQSLRHSVWTAPPRSPAPAADQPAEGPHPYQPHTMTVDTTAAPVNTSRPSGPRAWALKA